MDQPSEWTFDTYSGYRQALQDALSEAQQSVAIFDPDLAECGLESSTGLVLLESLCQRSTRADALRLLLEDAEFLERHCPRLQRLLLQYSHRVAVRLADAASRGWSQPFTIIDSEHLVLRFHRDLPRGRASLRSSTQTASLQIQFETMWLRGENRSIGAPLGL